LSEKFNINILLNIPNSLIKYKQDLELFIKNTLQKYSSKLEVKFIQELSFKTNMVISLVGENLDKNDEIFYTKYKSRELKFLFYYFKGQEVDLEDLDNELYKRVLFRDSLQKELKLCNDFIDINELKNSLKTHLNSSISDIKNRTNYSKINTSLMSRSKGEKFYDNESNLKKVDNFLRREKRVSLITFFSS
jgi:hypothetical protein